LHENTITIVKTITITDAPIIIATVAHKGNPFDYYFHSPF